MSDTRDRIIEHAATRFMRAGYAATGLKTIAIDADTPVGSLYHHFPGGKEEIGAVALRVAGVRYRQIVESVIEAAPDYVTGVRDAFAGAAAVLEMSDYADACPIATVALEVASTHEGLRQVTNDVFEDWISAGVRWGTAAGLSAEAARAFMQVFIAGLEGGFLLSRAAKSVESMFVIGDVVATELERQLALIP